jgi:naphtho-gamma-pyrone polyketide synthase
MLTLCQSVYADIALTLGEYMRSTKPDAADSGMDICNTVVQNPLIASNSGSPQLFRASATADWTTKTAVVSYYSVTPEGKKTIDHAKCTIKYANPDMWLEEWNRNAYLVRSRMGKILQGADGNGRSHRIKRGLAYKLFSSLVEYDQNFRGMEEVVLDSAELEATASIIFQAPKANFHTSPYWIDSLGHISGFVMNANDAVDSKAQVFINHGWESMRCAKALSPDKTYRTYVKMQQVAGKEQLFSGDVYIFEGEQIIGVNRGVQVSKHFSLPKLTSCAKSH